MWRYHYNSHAYCNNHNCYNKSSKPINVNSGSGSTLAKKAAVKYSKKSNNSNGAFSINGSTNQTYIGNNNTALSYLNCKQTDNTHKTSVKTYSALRRTRIVNSNIKCNPDNSFKCYQTLNVDLPDNINKHNLYNTHQSQHILANKCPVDRTDYINQLQNKSVSCQNKYEKNSKPNRHNCKITKDMNKIQGYTMGYDLYINDKIKNNCINRNLRDARTIAC